MVPVSLSFPLLVLRGPLICRCPMRLRMCKKPRRPLHGLRTFDFPNGLMGTQTVRLASPGSLEIMLFIMRIEPQAGGKGHFLGPTTVRGVTGIEFMELIVQGHKRRLPHLFLPRVCTYDENEAFTNIARSRISVIHVDCALILADAFTRILHSHTHTHTHRTTGMPSAGSQRYIVRNRQQYYCVAQACANCTGRCGGSGLGGEMNLESAKTNRRSPTV